MTGGARLVAGLSLLLLAVALIGYGSYRTWRYIQTLEGDLAFYQTRSFQLEGEAYRLKNDFEFTVQSDAFTAGLDALVETQSASERSDIAKGLESELSELMATYPDAAAVSRTLRDLVQTQDAGARAAQRDRLMARFPEEADIVEPVVVTEETLGLASTAVTVLGGLVSALLSLGTFVTGGSKRRYESELLALDVELKKVELARQKHAARDALGES